MPTIRREDKEIIHNLSLLGMLFGAFVGGFLTLHFHQQSLQEHDAATAVVETQSSLVRLSSNLTEEEVSVAQAAMGQVGSEVSSEVKAPEEPKNFWTGLSRWGLWGLCAGAAVTGAGAGYLSLWGAGWFGSIMTYWAIRGVYRVIRKTAPECAAAQRTTAASGASSSFQRDQNRLLPTLIKLIMLLTMALSVLAIVVWYLTSL